MKNLFKFIIFVFVVTVAINPLLLNAQVTYQTLESIPGVTNGNTYTAGEGSFYLLLNKIFTFGIGIAAALAVVMLAIGGIQYMMSDIPFIKGEGKDKMWNAVGGLILALGIFIFLSTINPDLTNLRLKLTQAPGVPPQSQTTPTPTPTPTPPVAVEEQARTAIEDDARVRNLLRECGVGVTGSVNSTCSRYGERGCTSVGGMSPNIINSLCTLKQACGTNCPVAVTGGTEFWNHGDGTRTAHRSGGNVVDLGKNSALNSFISSRGQVVGGSGCSVGPRFSLNGATYVDETIAGNAPHWHVCF